MCHQLWLSESYISGEWSSSPMLWSVWGQILGTKHWGCTDSVWPFREQLILDETEYCGICHKHCLSPPNYVLHHKWLHLCVPIFICALCWDPYITCTALTCMWQRSTVVQPGYNGSCPSITIFKAYVTSFYHCFY